MGINRVLINFKRNDTPDYWKSFNREEGVIIKRGNSNPGKWGTRYLVRFEVERWFQKDDVLKLKEASKKGK